jgi:hypothetical protein
MSTIKGDDEANSLKVSDRKAAANAENALRSTGPRTTSGKRNSSQNALKHGAYANASIAIRRGPFAEDADDLNDYIAEIVASYGPRDAAEYAGARRIAECYVRACRLSRLEAVTLGSASSADGRPEARTGLKRLVVNGRRFAAWLSTDDATGVDFDDILRDLHNRSLGDRIADADLEGEPDENAALDPQARVAWYVEHHFSSLLDAATWAMDLAEFRQRKLDELDHAVSIAAYHAMERINSVSVTSQRHSRELDSAQRQYHRLQQRPKADLPSAPPRNEPTEAA